MTLSPDATPLAVCRAQEQRSSFHRERVGFGAFLLALVLLILTGNARAQGFTGDPLPDLPAAVEGVAFGAAGDALVAAGEEAAYVLPDGADAWLPVDPLGRSNAAAASTPRGLVHVGGTTGGTPSGAADRVRFEAETLTVRGFPDLPAPAGRPAAAALGGVVYVLGDGGRPLWTLDTADDAAAWQTIPAPAGSLEDAALVAVQKTLYAFGTGLDGEPAAFALTPSLPDAAWEALPAPPSWSADWAPAAFGHAHVFLVGSERLDADGAETVLTFHTITGRWFRLDATGLDMAEGTARVAPLGDRFAVLRGASLQRVEPLPVATSYGLLDHGVVAAYLLGMIGIGWHFSRRGRDGDDYFRGGRKVPFWASGMSLFATGASAISLMAMPGMSYANDWTYFSITIASVIVLPVSLFFLAPLVRRLEIATAYEYLERRFGTTSRLVGSVIFVFTQVAGRMASVMLLPAIALSAITGVDMFWCIVVMGVITTVYTFLGGLEAVIWTDTIQGFVMVATVAGCLGLALWKLGMPAGEILETLRTNDKLQTLDLSGSLIVPTFWVFLIATLTTTVFSITDQNFVQRVQCTATLGEAKKAVATQMIVAVPINMLLFGLGTVLWLFYAKSPELLNPVMKTDGIYPFFAAQQLPAGASGLVVAALLAATMSTVSSSICAVSDIGVNDFYRRFRPAATDASSLRVGRALTVVTGVVGTLAAMAMSRSTIASVWDLATLVISLISSGILALFLLGLLTRRAHQTGALVGVAAGMAVVFWLRGNSPLTFWLYGFIGTAVAFAVGYVASLVLPGKPRATAGLTLFDLEPKPA